MRILSLSPFLPAVFLFAASCSQSSNSLDHCVFYDVFGNRVDGWGDYKNPEQDARILHARNGNYSQIYILQNGSIELLRYNVPSNSLSDEMNEYLESTDLFLENFSTDMDFITLTKNLKKTNFSMAFLESEKFRRIASKDDGCYSSFKFRDYIEKFNSANIDMGLAELSERQDLPAKANAD